MNRVLHIYLKKHIYYGTAAMYRSVSTGSSSRPTVITQTNGIREIVLSEPKTRNALSLSMMESIKEDISKNLNDEDLRCIVLSSTGSIFSAGHNLNELGAVNSEEQLKVFQKLTEIIMQIYKTPVPVIAKVNGAVYAAGVQLVASCDMVVCSEKSSFSTPGANVGIFCSTPGVAVSRLMSKQKSLYMLMTGLPMSAKDAYIAGLVSSVVPEEQLDSEMQKITDAIKSKSRAVVAFGKKFYYEQLNMNIKDAYNVGAQKMTENLSLPDGKEGISSFKEKRKPSWTHKS